MKHHKAKAAWSHRKTLHHPLLSKFIEQHGISHESIQVGWGLQPSGEAACRSSARSGDALLLIEDAFVRSIRQGEGRVVYGILADSRGMHYDTSGQSDLLKALDSGSPSGWMRAETIDQNVTAILMKRFREIGISKYNWFQDELYQPSQTDQLGILVIDQSRDKLSEADFENMLLTALDRSDSCPVYLQGNREDLLRPETASSLRKILTESRVHFLSPALSPAKCFSLSHTVIVGDSLIGMEALIHEKKVVTFGSPFFAGRGLTEDFSPIIKSSTRRNVSLIELFEMAYLRYCHYFDPDTGASCGLGEILDHIELQKAMFRENSGLSVTVGFGPWKRKIVRDFLRSPSGKITHVKDMSEASPDARTIVWGRKTEIPEHLQNRAIRIEDGFIRSKGLGAEFNFPYSWVFDETGIYFDPNAPSDLEIFYNKGFSDSDLAIANELIELLREKRLTKYNLTASPISIDKKVTQGRKIILVPGQVEADASILFGSPMVKSNLELLLRVRAEEPNAFLIFKAHPDLVAGARHGNFLCDRLEAASDLFVTEGNVIDWLEVCDEVHTMTSTVGFEALIRQVPVITYGMPFYAAWGLTTDHLECSRRQRKLTLEELVCGALVKYPRYINPATGEFTTVLKIIHLLTTETIVTDHRSWFLKVVFKFKKAWVKAARAKSKS